VGVITINEELIPEGFAWEYGRYCRLAFCMDWKRLEDEAKGARKGLWVDPAPTPPWEFRRQKRKHGSNR
jgi:micrococcal nuclease